MIVGISGKKQSGKNTVALIWQYLYDYYYNNYKHPITVEDFKEYAKNKHHLKSVWIQKSFAHKLKQVTCILLGCTIEQLEDPIFKETTLGEEWVKYELSYTSHDRLSYCNCPDYYKKYFCSKEEAVEYIEGNLEVDQDSIKISKVELTPRMLMQMIGTEFGRNIIHPNIWVTATFTDYIPHIKNYEFLTKSNGKKLVAGVKYSMGEAVYPNWIISDVRFPNEVKAIKDKGGILIRVDRFMCSKCGNTDNFEGGNDLCNECGHFKSNAKEHQSETALDNYQDWDYVIDNNYSLAELILKVRQIMFKEGIIYE